MMLFDNNNHDLVVLQSSQRKMKTNAIHILKDKETIRDKELNHYHFLLTGPGKITAEGLL